MNILANQSQNKLQSTICHRFKACCKVLGLKTNEDEEEDDDEEDQEQSHQIEQEECVGNKESPQLPVVRGKNTHKK